MQPVPFGTRIREVERTAREALDRGYAADLVWIENFASRRLGKARSELAERILSLGSIDRGLREALVALEAESVAERCARDIFSNADVRLRARFGLYADALPGRRIRLPHVRLDDERRVVPGCAPTFPSFDAWIDELREALLLALRESAEAALRTVVRHGMTSIARSRIAQYLEHLLAH